MALGSEHMPQAFIATLASHFQQLAAQAFASLPKPLAQSPQKSLQVDEKPLLVVVSSDLRQHPVGRFWLPIARQLRSQFRVISVAGHPRNEDPIRTELRQLSDEWWPLEAADVVNTAVRIREQAPQILRFMAIRPITILITTQRLATVQATYLLTVLLTPLAATGGLLICSYALDSSLIPVRKSSGPALAQSCYSPSCTDCLIPKLLLSGTQPPVYGSFNHTQTHSSTRSV